MTCFFSKPTCPGTPRTGICPNPPFGRDGLYSALDELRDRFADAVRHADLVIVGSYVPDGVEVGAWVTATARASTRLL